MADYVIELDQGAVTWNGKSGDYLKMIEDVYAE